jgi:hypothetical protein
MSTETNGAAAPNEPALPDAAIDAVIDSCDQPVIGDETHKLAQKYAELEQQLRAKDEAIARRDRDFAALRETTNKQSEMLGELVGGMRDAKSQSHQSQIEYFKAIQRKATAEADVATFDEADRQIRFLEQQRPGVADPKGAQREANQAPQQLPPPDPIAAAWAVENPWFSTDADLFDFALSRERRLMTKFPDTATRLAEVKKEVMKAFPEKFPNQARQQSQTVARPGTQTTAKPKQ